MRSPCRIVVFLLGATTVGHAATRILQWRSDVARSGAQLNLTVPEVIPALHWRQSGLHKGQHTAAKSSPIVLDDGTFIQAGDTGILYRFSIETGEVLWAAAQKRIAHFGYHSTPCVVYGVEAQGQTVKKDSCESKHALQGEGAKMDLVIIGSYDGVLAAWDLETGALVWENAKDVGMHIGASPACTSTSVYISIEFSRPVGGGVCKIRIRDGAREWCNYEMADHSHSSPAVDVARNLVVAGSNDGHLHVYRETDGVRLAAYNVSAKSGKEVKGAVLLYDGVAIFGSWARQIHAFDLNHLSECPYPEPVLEVIPRLFWPSTARTPNGAFPLRGNGMSSVALDSESHLLYFGSHDHYVRCVEARTGQLVWEHKTNDYVLSSGIVTKNAFLVGSSDGHVYAFDKKTGSLFWRFIQGRTGRITSTPAITHDGRWIVFNSDTYGFTSQNRCQSSVGALHVLKRRESRDEL